MQTFLPYPDFAESASVLDRQRLGKQRVETLQVMKALTVPGYGWQQHPIVKMWIGYERTLLDYQDAFCAEWVGRGYADTCAEKTLVVFEEAAESRGPDFRESGPPPWLGDEALHESHRSKLVAKDEQFYGAIFPEAERGLDYVWPGVTSSSQDPPVGERTAPRQRRRPGTRPSSPR
ncbi:MSMEG_6728 family protein [Pseudoclavibacter helvolus]|uniref:MSMEG_6728 family protein n=1 Tax=Pseudoclavibacter helvolus TaxID=255205 RepID=UPI003735EB49